MADLEGGGGGGGHGRTPLPFFFNVKLCPKTRKFDISAPPPFLKPGSATARVYVSNSPDSAEPANVQHIEQCDSIKFKL